MAAEQSLDALLNPALSVLVCGRTGIGKSTLVNSLIAKRICNVNDPGLEGGNFAPGTLDMKVVSKNLNGIVVNVWDSPGLEDGVRDDSAYLDKMEEICGEKMENIDVILYCTDMTVVRLPSEIKAMKSFSEKFGEAFWKKSVFVMTKGNAVGFQTKKAKSRDYHKNVYFGLKKKLCDQLIYLKISKNIAESIPAIVAGYIDVDNEAEEPTNEEHDMEDECCHLLPKAEEIEVQDTNRYLLYVSDQIKETKPPTRHDFLPEMWVACFNQIVNLKVRGYFWEFAGKDRILAKDCTSSAFERVKKATKEKMSKDSTLHEKIRHIFKSKKHNTKNPNTTQEKEESSAEHDTAHATTMKEGEEHLMDIRGASQLYLDDDQLIRTADGLEAVIKEMSQWIEGLENDTETSTADHNVD